MNIDIEANAVVWTMTPMQNTMTAADNPCARGKLRYNPHGFQAVLLLEPRCIKSDVTH